MDGMRETAAGGGGWDRSGGDDSGVLGPMPRLPEFSFGPVREVHNFWEGVVYSSAVACDVFGYTFGVRKCLIVGCTRA